MTQPGEDQFKIKLGRIVSHSGSKRAVSFASRLGRASKSFRQGGSRSYSGSRQARIDYFSRRVIVKISFVKMSGMGAATQAAHIDYIGRESAAPKLEESLELTSDKDLETDRGHLYDARNDHLDGGDFIKRTKEDPRQFRIIASPEDSHKLSSLTSFTRELMGEMEATLGTKLDWVAADHYDTATPHTHIVVSGTDKFGKTVTLSRDYIREGMRLQAERLVNLELGPILQPEAGLKLARQITQERFTQLDRSLLKMSDKGVVDLSQPPEDRASWSRRFDRARLQSLAKMGIAHKQGRHHWKLSQDLEPTLRELGERGDIIRTLQKSLAKRGIETLNTPAKIYRPDMGEITGRIIDFGVRDDVNDRSFMVVDSLVHGPIHVETGQAQNIEDISRGDVLNFSAREVRAKPSDNLIAKVAEQSDGTYGYNPHKALDPSVSIKYVEAHIRRLEALRRLGHVTRREDGIWQIPGDYLKRAQSVESQRAKANPVQITWRNGTRLKQLAKQIGRTWVDEELMRGTKHGHSTFAKDINEAAKIRRRFLFEQGILQHQDSPLETVHLKQLEQLDLQAAGASLKEDLGKPYRAAPSIGEIEGRLIDKVERPSGRYAIIERAKDFTLVPWRDQLEKRKGLEITGSISAGGISWQFGRNKGLEIQ